MSFPCTRCGACCLNIGNTVAEARSLPVGQISEIGKRYAAFPYSFDSSGKCEKLDEQTGLCSIYEDRPDVCRVDVFYEQVYRPQGLTIEEFYLFNAYCCNLLIDKFALPPQKKVLFNSDTNAFI
jgi:Fe-S-cluster containining protein